MIKNRREKGQALVEFALISVILFALLVGIADLARMYFTYSSMNNAVREGARYGIVNPNDTVGIKQRTEELLVVFGTEPKIEISFPDGNKVMGSRIRVKVDSDFSMLVLAIPPFKLMADATMRIENVP
jgi:hypothetical protein